MPFKSQNPNAETHSPHTAILRGYDDLEFDDLPAAEEIRPGMLLERANGEVRPHSNDGGPAAPMFAVERRERGQLADDDGSIFPQELSTGVNNSLYPPGDTVVFAGFDKLHRVWALLAPGAVVEGDEESDTPDVLVSNGDGTFRPTDTAGGETDENAIVRALESVDNSGGTEPTRVRVEVTQ